MTLVSKLLLGITVVMVIVNIALAGTNGDWALPVLTAISASPTFRPNKINLVLALCALVGLLVSEIVHSHGAEIFGLVAAVGCMLVAFSNRIRLGVRKV